MTLIRTYATHSTVVQINTAIDGESTHRLRAQYIIVGKETPSLTLILSSEEAAHSTLAAYQGPYTYERTLWS